MADQPSGQPESHFDQEEQTIGGNQTNVAGNIYVNLPPPDPMNQILRPLLITLCGSIILTIIGRAININLDLRELAVISIFVGIPYTLYHAYTLKQTAQQQREQKYDLWRTLPLSELDLTLTRVRLSLRPLVIDHYTHKLPLTKQQRNEWIQYQTEIALLIARIKQKGGNPQPWEFDMIEPPSQPGFYRWSKHVQRFLSYLFSILLIAAAALIGTTIPTAAERVVRLLFDQLPTPPPLPTPVATVNVLPTYTLTFTSVPTSQPTPTPVLLATATITPTLGNTPIPTNTATATLPSTATTVTLTLSPLPTITAILILEPRANFDKATPATATITPLPTLAVTATAAPAVTATLTPTAAPAAAISELTGYIAYPVFNGARNDTIVHDLRTNTVKYRVSNARQPDLRGGGYLLVNREGGSLLRVDINRGDERAITERDEDARPHWAPSDNRFVLESFEPDKNTTILKLHLDNTDPSNPPYLRNPNGGTTSGRNALFLADGRIAFNGCASWDAATSGNCGIWTMNTDGKGILQLTDQPHDYPSDNVGSQVLFTSDRDGNWEVHITAAFQPVRNLTNHPARDGLATLSPDGNYIAFVSDRDNQWGIWVMRTDGASQPTLLIADITFGTGDHDWTTEKISWGQ